MKETKERLVTTEPAEDSNETDNDPEAARKYSVLVSFTDEDGTVYWGGSQYPKDGYSPPLERVQYLQSAKTAFGKPVIGE